MRHKRAKKIVIPSAFGKNLFEFNNRFDKLIDNFRFIHVDFMDGKFVKTKGVEVRDIPELNNYSGRFFEAHLMVSDPENWINKLSKKGFHRVIFHIESTKTPYKTNIVIDRIKASKMIPFIAINPETSLESIEPYLKKVRGVLVMGVHPGKENQKFIVNTYRKVKNLKSLSRRLIVQVDGGINPRNAKKLVEYGVDSVNSGSYISSSNDPVKSWEDLYFNMNS